MGSEDVDLQTTEIHSFGETGCFEGRLCGIVPPCSPQTPAPNLQESPNLELIALVGGVFEGSWMVSTFFLISG